MKLFLELIQANSDELITIHSKPSRKSTWTCWWKHRNAWPRFPSIIHATLFISWNKFVTGLNKRYISAATCIKNGLYTHTLQESSQLPENLKMKEELLINTSVCCPSSQPAKSTVPNLSHFTFPRGRSHPLISYAYLLYFANNTCVMNTRIFNQSLITVNLYRFAFRPTDDWLSF